MIMLIDMQLATSMLCLCKEKSSITGDCITYRKCIKLQFKQSRTAKQWSDIIFHALCLRAAKVLGRLHI